MAKMTNNEWAEQVNDWIDLYSELMELRKKRIKENPTKQSTYISAANDFLYLGLSYYLKNKEIQKARKLFSLSSEAIIESFMISYDKSSQFYLGEKSDYANVSLTDAIDGFTAAVLSGDFQTGRRLAELMRVPPHREEEFTNPKKEDIIITNYAMALKHIFLGDDSNALEYVRATETWFEQKGVPQKKGFRKNFFHRARLVRSVLEDNPALFTSSMKEQLADHAKEARYGDISDTPEAYVYVDGVAFCNLARYYRMVFDVEADTIPKGLLIDL